MTDVFSPHKRSEIMSRVKNKNTKPEKLVRSLLHRMGFRFGLHNGKLPGSPDIVLTRHKKVVFVHGCFWHGHSGCKRAKRPTTNTEFWNTKIDKNIARDRSARRELRRCGWEVLVVWQCQTKDIDRLAKELARFMASPGGPGRA